MYVRSMENDSSFTIRRAQASDEAALGRLGATLLRLHHEFDRDRFLAPSPHSEAGYGQFLVAELANDDAVVFVAERNGKIVGYVYAGIEPLSWKELRDRAGFVHDVLVDDDARGSGIGARLIETAAEWLVTRGVPRVMLWTAESNTKAHRLFASLGFRRTMVEMTREAKRPG